MHPLKQALNLFKNEIRVSALLGGMAVLMTLLSLQIPIIGAWLMNLIFLFSPLYVWRWQKEGKKNFSSAIFKNSLPHLLLISFIMIPTGLLLGSAAGTLQRTDQLWIAIPQAFFLIYICLFFYLTASQAVMMCAIENQSLIRSLDVCFKKSFRNFSVISLQLFVVTGLFIPSLMLWGLGLWLVCPIFFFLIYYITDQRRL